MAADDAEYQHSKDTSSLSAGSLLLPPQRSIVQWYLISVINMMQMLSSPREDAFPILHAFNQLFWSEKKTAVFLKLTGIFSYEG